MTKKQKATAKKSVKCPVFWAVFMMVNTIYTFATA